LSGTIFAGLEEGFSNSNGPTSGWIGLVSPFGRRRVQVSDMRFSSRQFVLASALLAAWQVLGGGSRAVADYVSVACLSRGDEVPSAAALASRSWEHESAGRSGSSAVRDETLSPDGLKSERTQNPSPFARLLAIAWQMGVCGSTSTSSGSSFVTGPTSQDAGGVTHVDLFLTEVSGLLPPQGDAARPFSLTSFLFRPPRAS
jgi:hypothetical protein